MWNILVKGLSCVIIEYNFKIVQCGKNLHHMFFLFCEVFSGPKWRGNGRFKLATSTLWGIVPSWLCIIFLLFNCSEKKKKENCAKTNMQSSIIQ